MRKKKPYIPFINITNCLEKINIKYFMIVVYAMTVLFRFVIANYPKVVSVYPDELRYYAIADSLFCGNGITIHNIHTDFQKILYSIFLMPAFFFDSGQARMMAISCLNSVIISSGIIPTYLIAKKILSNKTDIITVIIMYVSLSELCYSMSFMSEVLYLPLGLWTVYAFYELISNSTKIRNSILLNILIGILVYIAYLNKEIAISFILAYTCFIFCDIVFNKKAMRKRIIDLLGMWFGFVLVFIIFKITLFNGMQNSYDQTDISAILSLYNVCYMIYAFLYNLILLILSFFILPIILPITFFKNMKIECKRFFIYLVVNVNEKVYHALTKLFTTSLAKKFAIYHIFADENVYHLR